MNHLPPSGSQAFRNKKPKHIGLNGVLLCCSQTVRKSRLRNMPREAPTPQARCESYIFFTRAVVPLSNSLFQKPETSGAFWLPLSRVWAESKDGSCCTLREMPATPRGPLLPLMTSVEVPVAHRGKVQCCPYGSQEPFSSSRCRMWFISSSEGKKEFWCAFLERLLGPDLLWPDLIEDFAEPITWDVLWQQSEQSWLIANYHLHVHRMKHKNSSFKKNNFLFSDT